VIILQGTQLCIKVGYFTVAFILQQRWVFVLCFCSFPEYQINAAAGFVFGHFFAVLNSLGAKR